MLEKYMTPLLMSYVDKYIKNLSPNDLGVSLWSGDVQLKNLELKLDVLEREFLFPVRFLSGRVHELTIHVPWTSLGSDSVVITLNTLECSLTYKDLQSPSQDQPPSREGSPDLSSGESDERGSDSGISDTSAQTATAPSYVQLLTQRILNNVHIKVNNLIFKYIEGDVVLSVNIKSAEMYTVNGNWERAFSDVAAPEYALRRVIDLVDLTVCLDHTCSSGRIEVYEEPMLYRAHISCRSLFTFPNTYSFSPTAIHVHVLCGDILLNMSDHQFPALIVLLRRLYYLTNSSSTTKQVVLPTLPPVMGAEEEGWIGWGWSMLGMSTFEEAKAPPTPPAEMLFNFSLFVQSFTVSCTQVLHAKRKRSAKYHFVPFLTASLRGMLFEYVSKGYYYSLCDLGLRGISASLTQQKERVFTCGEPESELGSLTAGSLFDEHPDLSYVDKKRASEGENVQFEKFPAMWLSLLNVIPELKQRLPSDTEDSGVQSTDRIRDSLEIFEMRVLLNHTTAFLNNSILTSLQLFLTTQTVSAFCDPLPATPAPKTGTAKPYLSENRLSVMAHTSISCMGLKLFLSASSAREEDGTHPVALFYTYTRADLDQHYPLWVSQLQKLGPQSPLTAKFCYNNYSIRVQDNVVGFCAVRDLHPQSSIVILPPTFLQSVVRVYCFPPAWLSAMGSMLEVRLEIPQVAAILTPPQLHLAHHFVAYWAYKLGLATSGSSVHGAALQELTKDSFNTDEQVSVEVVISAVGLKYCTTSVVNSAMVTVRGAEVFLYKNAEEAVCVLSGPAGTTDLYKTLDQSREGHVIPALLSLTLQWPHAPYKIDSSPSHRPVLILHTSGLVFYWDRELPRFLEYTLPANNSPYVTSECSLDTLSLTSSTPALSSLPPTPAFVTPSATPSGLVRKSPSPASDSAPPSTSASPVPPSPRPPSPDTSTGMYGVIPYLAVQISVAPVIAIFPCSGAGCPQGNITEYLQHTPSLEALLVCLPGALVVNELATCQRIITPQELPLSVTSTCSLVGAQYSALPWTITLRNMAVTTLTQHRLQPLLAPTNLKVVLALGSRGCTDLCLHADTDAISLSITTNQISQLCRVSETLLVDVTSSAAADTESLASSHCGSEVSSVHAYLPNLVCDPPTSPTPPEKDEASFYLWLQYTIPRVCVSVCGRVRVEAEEITASIDLEGARLTKKLKIANTTTSLTLSDGRLVRVLESGSGEHDVSVLHRNTPTPFYSIKIRPLQARLDAETVREIESILADISPPQPSTAAATPAAPSPTNQAPGPVVLSTASYPDISLELHDFELTFKAPASQMSIDDELVVHVSLLTATSNPDNLLSRVVLDRAYHQYLKSTDNLTRCNYQLQLEMGGVDVYTDRAVPDTPSPAIDNPAEAWGQRDLSPKEDTSCTIVQGVDLKVCFAPPVSSTKQGTTRMIYGLSAEVQVEPIEVLLAVDQLLMLTHILSALSPAPSSAQPVTSPVTSQPSQGHEVTVSVHKLKLLLHQRKEGKMFAVAEIRLEQCVLYSSQLLSNSTARCCVYQGSASVATHSAGVSYDGDLKCEGQLLSAVERSDHSPLLTFSTESNCNTSSWEVKLNHDVRLNLQVSFIERLLSVTKALSLPSSPLNPDEESTAPATAPALQLPFSSLEVVTRSCGVTLGEFEGLVRGIELTVRENAKKIRADLKLSGVSLGIPSHPLLLPLDPSLALSLHTTTGDLTASLTAPCLVARVGQRHLSAASDLVTQLSSLLAPPVTSQPTGNQDQPGDRVPVKEKGAQVSRHFTTCHQDDIRSSGYRFRVQEVEEGGRLEPETVLITPATITWRYPEKRSVVSMVTLPVLLAAAVGDQSEECIQCRLSYLDEFTLSYCEHAAFTASQVDVARFQLPSSVEAYQWRVEVLGVELVEEEAGNMEEETKGLAGTVPEEEEEAAIGENSSAESKEKDDPTSPLLEVDVSVFPALALAGCLCVDSLSTRAPHSLVSVHVGSLDTTLLHHYTGGGGDITHPDSELELLKLTGSDIVGRCETHRDTIQQVAGTVSLSYLDYSSLLFTRFLHSSFHCSLQDTDTRDVMGKSENVEILSESRPGKHLTLASTLTSLHLAPPLVTSLGNLTDSWMSVDGATSADQFCPYRTLVRNETPYHAQLMINGSRYLSCPGHKTVPCYWNNENPVFFALQSIHPSWSEPLDLREGSVVEDGGVFLTVELQSDGKTLVTITGKVRIVNRTELALLASFLPLDPLPNAAKTTTLLKVQELSPGGMATKGGKTFVLGSGQHAMSFALATDGDGAATSWSSPVRLHPELQANFAIALSPTCHLLVGVEHNRGHITVTLNPLFVLRNNFAKELLVTMNCPSQAVSKVYVLEPMGGTKQIFEFDHASFHNVGCKLDASLPLSMPVSSVQYVGSVSHQPVEEGDCLGLPWPEQLFNGVAGKEIRSVLIPHPEHTEWSLEGELQLSQTPHHTLVLDWWPSCLVRNDTSLSVTLRSAQSGTPPTTVPSLSQAATFNFKGQAFIGVAEEEGGSILWSGLLDLSYPEGQSTVFVEAAIPSNEQVCRLMLHCQSKDGVTLVTISPTLILSVKEPLISLQLPDKTVRYGEGVYAVLWWQEEATVSVAYNQSKNWSQPINLRSLPPRKGISVPTDRPSSPAPVVVCSVDHLAVTYVTFDINPCPQIFLRNLSEFQLIVSEALPPVFHPSGIRVDGHRTVLLRPFRSLYFDPFSTSDKLFVQEIEDSPDLSPRLSFAFSQPTAPNEPLRSHKMDLGRDGTREVEVDEVNTVRVEIARGSGGVITLDIRSEHMKEPVPMSLFTPSCPALSPRLPLDGVVVRVAQLDVSLFDYSERLVTAARVDRLEGSYWPGQSGGEEAARARVGGVQVDNCLTDQHYDYRVVFFAGSEDREVLEAEVKLHCGRGNALRKLQVDLAKVHVYLEDVYLYQLVEVIAQFLLELPPSKETVVREEEEGGQEKCDSLPEAVAVLMEELHEPLAVDDFRICPIEIELGVHASVKLFLSADSIPLHFSETRICKLFTIPEHFSQILLAKYISDTIQQAGWALASLDILGSPSLMFRTALSGVRDLVSLPYDGLTRGPTAFVTGIAAGSASLARNIGTGVITSVTNLAVSISRNMDRMSLDDGHTRLCAINRRRYKASHLGNGISKGLTGFALHMLSAVAGVVQQPIQELEGSEGVGGMTRGLVRGVSKGLVGVVTKPIGGAAELVANAGEGLLTGAGWLQAPQPLPQSAAQLRHSDSLLRLCVEVLKLASAADCNLLVCSNSPVSIYLVISPDKLFLIIDVHIQCFSLPQLSFSFTDASVSITYRDTTTETTGSGGIEKELLDKIRLMYDLPVEEETRGGMLIATLPLTAANVTLLQHLLQQG